MVFEDWGKRPKGFTQAGLMHEFTAKFKAVRSATFAVVPPSPIPGLGNAFGFDMMVEDRGGAGLHELQKSVNEILGQARGKPGFLMTGFYYF